jgi:integrase
MGYVAQGRNPADERKKAAEAERARRVRDRLTLRVLIEDWRQLHLAMKRPRYAVEAVRALHHAFADVLDDAAEDLSRAAVMRVLDARLRQNADGAGSQKGRAMAGRVMAYGRAVFNWAVKRGLLQTNPFSNLPIATNIARRERVLSDQEIVEIWAAAGKAAAPYGLIVRLLILTGQRRNEVGGMAWSELSDELASWTVPGERTKKGVANTIPMSEPARNLLRALLPDDANEAARVLAERRATGALVLPSARGGTLTTWAMSKIALDRAITETRAKAAAATGTTATPLAPWCVHDLRRVVATGLQRLGVRLEVTEAVLNHISGSRGGITGVYQRHSWATEKRAALDAWAAHVLAMVEQRPAASNVVNLARAG